MAPRRCRNAGSKILQPLKPALLPLPSHSLQPCNHPPPSIAVLANTRCALFARLAFARTTIFGATSPDCRRRRAFSHHKNVTGNIMG